MRIFGYHAPASLPPEEFRSPREDPLATALGVPTAFRWHLFSVGRAGSGALEGPLGELLAKADAGTLAGAIASHLDRNPGIAGNVTVLVHWGPGGFFALGSTLGCCSSCGLDGTLAVGGDGTAAVASGLVVSGPSAGEAPFFPDLGSGRGFSDGSGPGFAGIPDSRPVGTWGPAAAARSAYLLSGRRPCLDLDGPLAAVIADPANSAIHAQRDLFGQRRIYGCFHGGKCGFSDHPEFVSRMVLGRVDTDPSGLDLVLSYNYSPAAIGPMARVSSLAGGSSVSVSAGGERVSRSRRPLVYQSSGEVSDGGPAAQEFPGPRESCPGTSTRQGTPLGIPDEVLRGLQSEISGSIADLKASSLCPRCGKGPEPALLLSGGIDSAAVALSWPGGPAGARAYGLDFRPGQFSEAPRFTLTASRLSMLLRIHRVGPAHIGWLPAVSRAMGWPAGDASFLAMAAAGALAASEGRGLLFTGDGGDEIAGGYDRMSMLRESGTRGGDKGSDSAQLTAYLRTLELFDAETRRRLYRFGFLESLQGRVEDLGIMRSAWEGALKSAGPGDVVSADAACMVDSATLLPGNNCPKTEAMLGLSGIIGAAPLMCGRVTGFLASLPPAMRNSGGCSKAVLRALVERGLPEFISRGRKRMLTVPVGEWYKGPLGPWLEKLASGPLAAEETVFRRGTMRELLSGHMKSGETRRLRAFLALETFLRANFGSHPPVEEMFCGFPGFRENLRSENVGIGHTGIGHTGDGHTGIGHAGYGLIGAGRSGHGTGSLRRNESATMETSIRRIGSEGGIFPPSSCEILMVSYGGGHSEITAAVGAALLDLGIRISVLALNTARGPLARALGSERVFGVSETLKTLYGEEGTLEIMKIGRLGATALGLRSHAWSEEETRSYLGVSLCGGEVPMDSKLLGERLSALEKSGRGTLEPPSAFASRLVSAILPAGLFTTNGPRFEQAFRSAAIEAAVPVGAAIDFLGNTELCRVEADRLFVMNAQAALNLEAQGYDPEKIEITGQPALDGVSRRSGTLRRGGGGGSNSMSSPSGGSHAGPVSFKVLVATQPTETRAKFLAAVSRAAASALSKTAGEGIPYFLVTPHPSDDEETWNGISSSLDGTPLVPAPRGTRTRECLDWADLLVTEYSSTILESVAAGVPAISVNCSPGLPARQHEALKDWAAVLCCEIDELEPLLGSILETGVPPEAARALSMVCRDGLSACRVAASMAILSGLPRRSQGAFV